MAGAARGGNRCTGDQGFVTVPHAPMKPCTWPGCGTLVPSTQRRCDMHRKQEEKARTARRRANPNDQIHFHNSRLWRDQIRPDFLRRNPLCAVCLEQGRTTPAAVVDHIVSITDGGSRTDDNNLQGLCKSCHESKTWTEINRRRTAPRDRTA